MTICDRMGVRPGVLESVVLNEAKRMSADRDGSGRDKVYCGTGSKTRGRAASLARDRAPVAGRKYLYNSVGGGMGPNNATVYWRRGAE